MEVFPFLRSYSMIWTHYCTVIFVKVAVDLGEKKAFILGLFPQLSYIHSIIRHKKQKRNYSVLNRFVKPFYTVSLLSIF